MERRDTRKNPGLHLRYLSRLRNISSEFCFDPSPAFPLLLGLLLLLHSLVAVATRSLALFKKFSTDVSLIARRIAGTTDCGESSDDAFESGVLGLPDCWRRRDDESTLFRRGCDDDGAIWEAFWEVFWEAIRWLDGPGPEMLGRAGRLIESSANFLPTASCHSFSSEESVELTRCVTCVWTERTRSVLLSQ